ncbi:23S ribosomal RNA methyltransferase Erm [Arthrobacter sp. ATA002]|uniref:ribosomal RNA small subunit methyltransferase A n=1 Tax=Arthrobacter sp. ATA002 TaxID=2991715 RepID=UPI0022A69627|nr:rRNA adenine N-6-methyltransferase family protein [Arthrobacter sp. ATA002]WAP50536.1 23S ribosomal RNA methyltransferase Erm [Arthrobacter sp. ATA002]
MDIDPRSVARLRRRLAPATPGVVVLQADALSVPLDRRIIAGNIPYHLTTPILRRLLASGQWQDAVLLTQWEVARKRAGVGGGTMLTAQSAPWFEFALHCRVPASGFRPQPGVDGGVLTVQRRPVPLVEPGDRTCYSRFVKDVFTGPGSGLEAVLAGVLGGPRTARSALAAAGIPRGCLPRDVPPTLWPILWREVCSRGVPRAGRRVRG